MAETQTLTNSTSQPQESGDQAIFCPGCKEGYAWTCGEDSIPTSLTCGHSLCFRCVKSQWCNSSSSNALVFCVTCSRQVGIYTFKSSPASVEVQTISHPGNQDDLDIRQGENIAAKDSSTCHSDKDQLAGVETKLPVAVKQQFIEGQHDSLIGPENKGTLPPTLSPSMTEKMVSQEDAMRLMQGDEGFIRDWIVANIPDHIIFKMVAANSNDTGSTTNTTSVYSNTSCSETANMFSLMPTMTVTAVASTDTALLNRTGANKPLPSMSTFLGDNHTGASDQRLWNFIIAKATQDKHLRSGKLAEVSTSSSVPYNVDFSQNTEQVLLGQGQNVGGKKSPEGATDSGQSQAPHEFRSVGFMQRHVASQPGPVGDKGDCIFDSQPQSKLKSGRVVPSYESRHHLSWPGDSKNITTESSAWSLYDQKLEAQRQTFQTLNSSSNRAVPLHTNPQHTPVDTFSHVDNSFGFYPQNKSPCPYSKDAVVFPKQNRQSRGNMWSGMHVARPCSNYIPRSSFMPRNFEQYGNMPAFHHYYQTRPYYPQNISPNLCNIERERPQGYQTENENHYSHMPVNFPRSRGSRANRIRASFGLQQLHNSLRCPWSSETCTQNLQSLNNQTIENDPPQLQIVQVLRPKIDVTADSELIGESESTTLGSVETTSSLEDKADISEVLTGQAETEVALMKMRNMPSGGTCVGDIYMVPPVWLCEQSFQTNMIGEQYSQPISVNEPVSVETFNTATEEEVLESSACLTKLESAPEAMIEERNTNEAALALKSECDASFVALMESQGIQVDQSEPNTGTTSDCDFPDFHPVAVMTTIPADHAATEHSKKLPEQTLPSFAAVPDHIPNSTEHNPGSTEQDKDQILQELESQVSDNSGNNDANDGKDCVDHTAMCDHHQQKQILEHHSIEKLETIFSSSKPRLDHCRVSEEKGSRGSLSTHTISDKPSVNFEMTPDIYRNNEPPIIDDDSTNISHTRLSTQGPVRAGVGTARRNLSSAFQNASFRGHGTNNVGIPSGASYMNIYDQEYESQSDIQKHYFETGMETSHTGQTQTPAYSCLPVGGAHTYPYGYGKSYYGLVPSIVNPSAKIFPKVSNSDVNKKISWSYSMNEQIENYPENVMKENIFFQNPSVGVVPYSAFGAGQGDAYPCRAGLYNSGTYSSMFSSASPGIRSCSDHSQRNPVVHIPVINAPTFSPAQTYNSRRNNHMRHGQMSGRFSAPSCRGQNANCLPFSHDFQPSWCSTQTSPQISGDVRSRKVRQNFPKTLSKSSKVATNKEMQLMGNGWENKGVTVQWLIQEVSKLNQEMKSNTLSSLTQNLKLLGDAKLPLQNASYLAHSVPNQRPDIDSLYCCILSLGYSIICYGHALGYNNNSSHTQDQGDMGEALVNQFQSSVQHLTAMIDNYRKLLHSLEEKFQSETSWQQPDQLCNNKQNVYLHCPSHLEEQKEEEVGLVCSDGIVRTIAPTNTASEYVNTDTVASLNETYVITVTTSNATCNNSQASMTASLTTCDNGSLESVEPCHQTYVFSNDDTAHHDCLRPEVDETEVSDCKMYVVTMDANANMAISRMTSDGSETEISDEKLFADSIMNTERTESVLGETELSDEQSQTNLSPKCVTETKHIDIENAENIEFMDVNSIHISANIHSPGTQVIERCCPMEDPFDMISAPVVSSTVTISENSADTEQETVGFHQDLHDTAEHCEENSTFLSVQERMQDSDMLDIFTLNARQCGSDILCSGEEVILDSAIVASEMVEVETEVTFSLEEEVDLQVLELPLESQHRKEECQVSQNRKEKRKKSKIIGCLAKRLKKESYLETGISKKKIQLKRGKSNSRCLRSKVLSVLNEENKCTKPCRPKKGEGKKKLELKYGKCQKDLVLKQT